MAFKMYRQLVLLTLLICGFAYAGNDEITFKGAKATYTCRATACFKKDTLQKDYDSAMKDSSYWCDSSRKGGADTCKYYEEKVQAIKQCDAECSNARCTKQDLTNKICLVAEFR